MNGKENPIELLVICAVVLVLSLLGILGGFSKGLFGNMDGILILGICLMMALIAAILLLVLAKEQGWLGKKSDSSGAPSATAK
jgi:uncharacterized RDD family membrane protein YckC